MEKVLIITYYWPPSGGAGVQRWVKFAKYLEYFNFEPVVITVDPEQASYPVKDPTLANDLKNINVIRTKTSEPYDFYRNFSKKREIPYGGFANEASPGFAAKISRFIRGNFFIPDARKGWNKYALKSARKIILKYGIKNLVTTSPPHSSQLIGLKLKSEFDLNWIADLRDPWTDIYYYKLFYHTRLSASIDQHYEKRVLRTADKIVVVSDSIKKLLSAKISEYSENKISVIPNGYDKEDFVDFERKVNDSFVITYTGTIADDYHIESFLKAVSKLRTNNIKLRLVGAVSDKYKNMIDRLGLGEKTWMTDHVKHDQAIRYMVTSDLLFLAIPDGPYNKGILTGKLFEYLASGTKIIGLGPVDGDAGKIIDDCQAGKMFDYQNESQIGQYLEDRYTEWQLKKDVKTTLRCKQYERKELTAKIAALLTD